MVSLEVIQMIFICNKRLEMLLQNVYHLNCVEKDTSSRLLLYSYYLSGGEKWVLQWVMGGGRVD